MAGRWSGIMSAAAAGFWLAGCASGGAVQSPVDVRLNELQFIGTHNSYHVAPDQAVFDLMTATDYRESADWPAQRLIPALSFTHPNLTTQLERGVRVVELDIHDDPAGGRFAEPGFLKALPGDAVAALTPVDPAGELKKPGFKVFHTADTDVRSTCLRLVLCLEEIRAWSTANPGHTPIFVQIESKEGRKPALGDAYEPAEPAPFDASSWARLHAEIRSVFSQEQMFLPRELQGDHAHVNAAVRAGGWPPADDLAGRVIFLLLDDPEPQDAYAAFTESVEEPLLFVSRNARDPRTAWLITSTPSPAKIRPLIAQGFLVYTRADANSVEPRAGDMSRARAAMESGAHLISTDYPWPDEAIGSYAVSFGGRFVRCNPVMRPQGCSAYAGAKKRS